jgi:hypothetical protein
VWAGEEEEGEEEEEEEEEDEDEEEEEVGGVCLDLRNSWRLAWHSWRLSA